MMNTIIKNWTPMRAFRLLLGLILLAQAIIIKDALYGFLSAFLLITALANIGCCGAGSCAVAPKNKNKQEELSFEEVDNQKEKIR